MPTHKHTLPHTSIEPWQFSWRFVPNIYEKQNLLCIVVPENRMTEQSLLNNNNKNTAKDSHSIKYSLVF